MTKGTCERSFLRERRIDDTHGKVRRGQPSAHINVSLIRACFVLELPQKIPRERLDAQRSPKSPGTAHTTRKALEISITRGLMGRDARLNT
ncbi:hypothetical protein NDU88_001234 [Pleurodeles waltl]|uniref:Uncharacterized protein n=1 Tax=Pleurodeles waltl TaxID=8319 RepID=A0AAV7V782_PLEWA|nr:hypothetical protein NDU88_001234 [Pleurodeles waltl]